MLQKFVASDLGSSRELELVQQHLNRLFSLSNYAHSEYPLLMFGHLKMVPLLELNFLVLTQARWKLAWLMILSRFKANGTASRAMRISCVIAKSVALGNSLAPCSYLFALMPRACKRSFLTAF